MRFVKWEITHACNLRCTHCSVGDLLGPSTFDLPFDEVCRILREVADLGATQLNILGGEPLSRRDIFEIVKYATSLGISVSLVTNGIGLSSETVDKFETAGLVEMTVSIDGPSEEIYDQIRGRGQFRRLIAALDDSFAKFWNGSKCRFRLCINTVLEKSNSTHESTIDFLKVLSRYPVSLWRLLSLCNEGEAGATYSNRTLTPTDRISYARMLAILICNNPTTFEIDPQFFAPLVWHYLRLTGTDLPWPQLCCDAATDMLFIDGKGMAHSCDRPRHLPTTRTTNLHNPTDVRGMPILNIIDSPSNHEFYQFLSNFHAKPTYQPCDKCYYHSSGRCEPCALFHLEGSKNPYEPCLHVAKLMEQRGISISEPLSLPGRPPRHESLPVELGSFDCIEVAQNQVLRVADNVLTAIEAGTCFLYQGQSHKHFRLSGVAALTFLLVDGNRRAEDVYRVAASLDKCSNGVGHVESLAKSYVRALLSEKLITNDTTRFSNERTPIATSSLASV